jgi:DNA-binding transcriptional MerR regulator
MKQGELAQRAGWDTSRIDYYVNAGVLKPERPSEGGRGKHHKYGEKNLRECLILKALQKFGVPLETVKRIMAVIYEQKPEALDPNFKCFLLLRHRAGRIDVQVEPSANPKDCLVRVRDLVRAESAIVVNLVG